MFALCVHFLLGLGNRLELYSGLSFYQNTIYCFKHWAIYDTLYFIIQELWYCVIRH